MYRLEMKFLMDAVPEWAELLKGCIEKQFICSRYTSKPVTQLSEIRAYVEQLRYFVGLHERSLKGRVSPIKGKYESGFSFHIVSTDCRWQIMDIMYVHIK